MAKQVIIGAGLSGMVAAINLAREGRDVLVRERRDVVGGKGAVKGLEDKVVNIGDGTSLDPDRIRAYTGIDVSPAVTPLEELRVHAFGRTFDIEMVPSGKTYLTERGPRPTSLDVYLYELARSEGVEFSFNDALDTEEDFRSLPPDTIIATGVFGEAFRILDVPHMPIYGYLAMGETDDLSTRVVIYFDEYTRDYAFYSQINGARGAVLFSRGRPLDRSAKDRFRRQLSQGDGVEFDEWDSVDVGVAPVRCFSNPRLFARNFILAGTISGTMDPYLLFGVHGALVSGKIAAAAVTDRQKALEEFKRINMLFKLSMAISYGYRYMPLPLLKRFLWVNMWAYPLTGRLLGERLFGLIPGVGRI